MIKILENATNKLNELRQQKDKKFVRLSVSGGGCAGLGYDWDFEDIAEPSDIVVDNMLLIDQMFEMYISGMQLDYNSGKFESGFTFNNPLASSQCGCGTSFSIQ
jgi:iron-sulfur cluster assembly protein